MSPNLDLVTSSYYEPSVGVDTDQPRCVSCSGPAHYLFVLVVLVGLSLVMHCTPLLDHMLNAEHCLIH